MTEYEIYVMKDLKYWVVGVQGKAAVLPSRIDGAGAGASVSLDEFIETMKETIGKAIKQGDTAVYKEGYPPWWDLAKLPWLDPGCVFLSKEYRKQIREAEKKELQQLLEVEKQKLPRWFLDRAKKTQ